MNDEKGRPLPLRALLIAPWASVPAITIAGLGSSDGGIAPDVVAGIVFGILIALPCAYLGMIVIGLPVYLLLRQFDLLRIWIVCAAGLIVPYFLMHDAPLRTTVGAMIAGLAVGIAAYLLAPTGTHP